MRGYMLWLMPLIIAVEAVMAFLLLPSTWEAFAVGYGLLSLVNLVFFSLLEPPPEPTEKEE